MAKPLNLPICAGGGGRKQKICKGKRMNGDYQTNVKAILVESHFTKQL
jgi:hypothetical protein